MAPLEISVPSTSISDDSSSAHTLYHLTLRLPLRTFTLTKRYSDFVTLHTRLTTEAGGSPPADLPPKTSLASALVNPGRLFGSSSALTNPGKLFGASASTVTDPQLAENRRQGLEAYLRGINDAPDPRWRQAPSWRAFLNLPASVTGSSAGSTLGTSAASSATTLHAASTAPSGPIADPVAWLDAHRELKALLHAARAAIASRDGSGVRSSASPDAMRTSFSDALPAGNTPAAAHEAAAAAKKQLVRASALLGPLDQGLTQHGGDWSRHSLGAGEVRRRKDLLAAARHEIASLEGLLVLVRRKGEVDGVVDGLARAEDGHALSQALGPGHKPGGKSVTKGRVLGKETARTRALDNAGVAQLQQTVMREQDEDVAVLAQAVRRQRELGEQIATELAVHNEMLELLDEDVERVGGKVRVGRKRVDEIS